MRIASPIGTEAVGGGSSGDRDGEDERQHGVADHKWVCCKEGECEVISEDRASDRDDRRRRGPGRDDRRGNGCHDESEATPVSKTKAAAGTHRPSTDVIAWMHETLRGRAIDVIRD